MMKTQRRTVSSSDRRRAGLFKKARELGILCGCEIGIILYSSKGELFQYSNVSINDLISRYRKAVLLKTVRTPHVESSGTSGRLIATQKLTLSTKTLKVESQNSPECHAAIQELDLLNAKQERTLVEIFTEQVKKIQSRQRPLSEEDKYCVQKLLEMIEEFLVLIQEREEVLVQKQQQSRLQEEQHMQETEAPNETARYNEPRAINFLDLFSSTLPKSEPVYIGSGLMQQQSSSSYNNISVTSLKLDDGEDDLDTKLQLGIRIPVDQKKPNSGR